MKIIYENTIYLRKTNEYTIKLDSGTELVVRKSWSADEVGCDYDSEWEIADESQKVFDKLPEDEQEDIRDFLEDLE